MEITVVRSMHLCMKLRQNFASFTQYSNVVQCCTLYGNITHIANTRYTTSLAKKREIHQP